MKQNHQADVRVNKGVKTSQSSLSQLSRSIDANASMRMKKV
jgi:hypothetical protein